MAAENLKRPKQREMVNHPNVFRASLQEVLLAQSKISNSIRRRQTLDIERFDPLRITADEFIEQHHQILCSDLQNHDSEMDGDGDKVPTTGADGSAAVLTDEDGYTSDEGDQVVDEGDDGDEVVTIGGDGGAAVLPDDDGDASDEADQVVDEGDDGDEVVTIGGDGGAAVLPDDDGDASDEGDQGDFDEGETEDDIWSGRSRTLSRQSQRRSSNTCTSAASIVANKEKGSDRSTIRHSANRKKLSFEQTINRVSDKTHSATRTKPSVHARGSTSTVRPPPLVRPHNISQLQPSSSTHSAGRRPVTTGQGGGKGRHAQTGKVVKGKPNDGRLSLPPPAKKVRSDDDDYCPSNRGSSGSDFSRPATDPDEAKSLALPAQRKDVGMVRSNDESLSESSEEETSAEETDEEEEVDSLSLFQSEADLAMTTAEHLKAVEGGCVIDSDSADEDYELSVADDDQRMPASLSRRSKFHRAMMDQDMSCFTRIRRKDPAEAGCYLTLGMPPHQFLLSESLQHEAGEEAEVVFASYEDKDDDDTVTFDEEKHSREAKFREKEKTGAASFEPYILTAETVATTESMYKYVQFVITAITRTSTVGTTFYEELTNTTAKVNVSRMIRSQVDPYRTILTAAYNWATRRRITLMTPVEERVVVYEAIMKLKASLRSRNESNKLDDDGVKKEAKRRLKKQIELDQIDF